MIIYKITNLKNGKIYIGKTIKTLKQRWSVHVGHSKRPVRKASYIQNAIAKYGSENFKIEQIDSANSAEELKEKEIFHIKSHKSHDPKIGYNLIIESVGGQGVDYLSESTRSKLSISSHSQLRKSSHSGVSYANSDGKHSKSPWMTKISFGGATYRKRFSNKDEAVTAYDKLSLFLYKSNAVLNREDLRSEYEKENLKEYFNWFSAKRINSSSYRGVRYDSKAEKWMARAQDGKSRLYLGCYESEVEAAETVDKIELFLGKTELNFPDKKTEYLKSDLKELYKSFKDSVKQINRETTSKFRGVTKHKQSENLWSWELRVNRKRFRGTCSSEIAAAKAYDEKAVSLLGDKARLNHA